jgi:hypothetical protein
LAISFSKHKTEISVTGKITAAVVAAILLGSAGAASAQIGRTGPTYSPYYNRNYWEGVAPAGRIYQRDPYAGTVFDGVAPY